MKNYLFGLLCLALAWAAAPNAVAGEEQFTQLVPEGMSLPDGSYGLGVRVPAGYDLAFISGRTGANPDGSYPEDFEAEARNAIGKITALLNEAGMDWSNAVSITIYLTDRETIPVWMKVRDEVIGENRPSGTGILVADLVPPDARIEISAVGAKKPQMGDDHE